MLGQSADRAFTRNVVLWQGRGALPWPVTMSAATLQERKGQGTGLSIALLPLSEESK